MTAIGWVCAVLSLIATVANVRKLRWCFGVWVLTNLTWTAIDARAGLWSQAALQLTYAGLAVWGILRWGKKTP